MNRFKHAKWWRSYLYKLKQGFLTFTCLNFKWKHEHKQWRRGKQSEEAKRKAAAVFFRTFGVLPEFHFLHAIYHFKALEVKNPTLQTVHDLELKWGRYGLWKTTASAGGQFRTVRNWNSNVRNWDIYADSFSSDIFVSKFPFFSLYSATHVIP